MTSTDEEATMVGDGVTTTDTVAMPGMDRTPKALALRDPMPLRMFVDSMRSVLDDSDKVRALVWRQDAYRLCNELDVAIARAEAAKRVVDISDDVADVLIRYAGAGHYQCRVCMAAELGKAITHDESCPVPELQSALDAYATPTHPAPSSEDGDA